MDEAAFGRFNMVLGERVWDTSELKAVHPVKRFRVEYNWIVKLEPNLNRHRGRLLTHSIPATLNWDW